MRRLIAHVMRRLRTDCSEIRMQVACAKLISRMGLLVKLLSEQQKVSVSKAQWNAEPGESEDYTNESTAEKVEGKGEKKYEEKQESRQFPKVPQLHYHRLILLLPVMGGVVMISMVIFCLIKVRITMDYSFLNASCLCSRFRTHELRVQATLPAPI
ncbi:PREDICTED: leucine-rich repeat-containing protein 37A3-like [Chinchilla lanigera]|uniref:leucine-rich repeat-containing protein 37A3-like n=1 Tax=Chinchilla lanigera TaxID=34839 RepID=UPI0006964F1E|nr:PREDICTED: leucine-rich repeat-containing protein 37A3-like [Chinchilla lanigera]